MERAGAQAVEPEDAAARGSVQEGAGHRIKWLLDNALASYIQTARGDDPRN